MPMYDFQCQGCKEVTEVFLSASHADDVFVCPRSGDKCGKCIRIVTLGYEGTRNAVNYNPVVVQRHHRTGELRFPGHSNAPVMKGFERVELTTSEVRKMEKKVNEEQAKIATAHNDTRANQIQARLDTNRKVMESQVLPRFSTQGQEFYAAARRSTDAKLKEMRAKGRRDPGFHVEALSQTASNRDNQASVSSSKAGIIRGDKK